MHIHGIVLPGTEGNSKNKIVIINNINNFDILLNCNLILHQMPSPGMSVMGSSLDEEEISGNKNEKPGQAGQRLEAEAGPVLVTFLILQFYSLIYLLSAVSRSAAAITTEEQRSEQQRMLGCLLSSLG